MWEDPRSNPDLKRRGAQPHRTIQFLESLFFTTPETLALGVPDFGAVAQLGERLLCKQEVTSSILVGSTNEWARSSAG